MITNNFIERHNGPRINEINSMLEKIGVSSLNELINQTIPKAIRMKKPLNLPDGMNEYEYLNHLKKLASKNKIFKSYIGLGYYNTITPGVILRNVLENPGWYTSYTPYQAEISQGRLEALLNFQTMVSDLTGLPISNASLLDEGTAAAEAMIMLFNARQRTLVKREANVFFVSENLFPQTIEILKQRSKPLGIELIIGDHEEFEFNEKIFGAIVQYPDQFGEIHDYRTFVEKAHEHEAAVAVAADIMSMTLLTPPGVWGADVVVGSTQRFGIPMGYGGPHAGYFSTTEKYKRNIPGRIIGVSVDAKGNRALRMALQTREQHIKRERATSNICTAQALLASMAGFYATYHGQEGIKAIAKDINNLTKLLADELPKYGFTINNKYYFDTLTIALPDSVDIHKLKTIALNNNVNFRYINKKNLSISLDETTGISDVKTIINILATSNNKHYNEIEDISEYCEINSIPDTLIRTSEYLIHSVFNSYHSETEMMRYLKRLENKDLALNRTMIPLGSCTMKLNAAAELFALSWPEFGEIHPFVPEDQAKGYAELIKNLEKDFCEITGFAAISFQPNSGAAGEYAGLMVIREYLKSKGEEHRNICLIPASAHGTNPASSVMAGLKVIIVKCDEQGNIDINDLTEKAGQCKDDLAAIMVTYPSTHGVYEEKILEVIDIIHKNGGQVYMDGANMNAQVGLTNPEIIGADVCHLNLHKTFGIPHGGGGPGVGPIGVAKHLMSFLPKHPLVKTGGEKGIAAIASAPFGSAMILPVSYGYLKLLGGKGLTEATKIAILNANYLKSCLEDHYKIFYSGKNNRVAHEMILDCNIFHKTADVTVANIAKRLMDYGFHAPTVAFPVHGTLMVEPTESEPLAELNRFVEAMIGIRKEIKEIEDGKADKTNNVVINAPHTVYMVTDDNWEYPYSRKKAAFPVYYDYIEKYWTPVTKIDDAFGDRNLVCTCVPTEKYESTE
ncbi:MAG: aminomethyl-transferring glycine dehydrogenase [Bacteroidetes bacterium]|nr:aminomethyl-transferring glycine dehydrogenase [Bacteroidota bacterium]MBL7103335.1 aminomethyl-transferring glycine dehydrogenase [Bacteroidales bacterium]